MLYKTWFAYNFFFFKQTLLFKIQIHCVRMDLEKGQFNHLYILNILLYN